jgi:hypothetical protein
MMAEQPGAGEAGFFISLEFFPGGGQWCERSALRTTALGRFLLFGNLG